MIVLTLSLAHQTVKLRTNLEKEQNRRREISEKSSQLDTQLLAEQKRVDQLLNQLEEPGSNLASSNGRPMSSASLELTPGISRGAASIPALLVPQGAIFIEIDLKVLRGDYKEFRVELYDAVGREIAMQDLLQAVKGKAGKYVPFKYPAERLAPGDYKLQLKVIDGPSEPIVLGNYYFRINRHS
jgi:hypothetical protein